MKTIEFSQEINPKHLRVCQSKAYYKILKHFRKENAEKHVLIQLPTGTGKSALIAIAPFTLANKKVLIVTPNLTLSEQLQKDLDFSKYPDNNIYKKLDLIPSDKLDELDLYILNLDSKANYSDIEEHQIIIANYQQLNNIEKWFKNRKYDIDLIIIDEAHHQKAKTYQGIIKFFNKSKIISLTATPFRTDGQKIDGKNIYTYHFKEAIENEYIRNIKVSNISPKKIALSFTGSDKKTYSLEKILEMKEEAWFRNGVALSQDCCDSIALKSYHKLQKLKNDYPSTSHQIIAVAMSIRHARELVKPAFEKLGLKVGLVSSKNKNTNEKILKKLYQEKIDVIVNIGMLGEGFDHNKLGVAAIFRPFATLNPYIQFIGRVIRRNGDTKFCYVVSHLGLNQIKRFNEFKLFDNDDKDFIESLFQYEDDTFLDENSNNNKDKKTKDKSSNRITINELGNKVIGFEDQLVKDKEKISNAIDIVNLLNKEEQEEFFKQYGLDYKSVTIKNKKKIKPIDKRISSKNTLHEKAKSIASDVIRDINIEMYGNDFDLSKNNFAWILSRVNRDINKTIGIAKKQRKNLSNAELDNFFETDALDNIKIFCIQYFKDELDKN